MTREGIAIIAGFIGGALVGFAWAQTTKAGLADHVKTKTEGGKILIEADLAGAAQQGLTDLVSGKW